MTSRAASANHADGTTEALAGEAMLGTATAREQAAQRLEQLLARVVLGDRAAFAQLYAASRRELFGVAWRVLGNREEAEEALQEGFVNIWRHASDYRPASSRPMTWMTSIVRNKSLDMLRSEGKHQRRAVPGLSVEDAPEDALQFEGQDPDPSELLQRASEAIGIRACLGVLDPAPRQALALAYYKGLSHSEIGELMGAPVGSVKSWVRRGLDRLRHCLEMRGAIGGSEAT